MTDFKFQPVSFSWVALHPQPRGVIQFIGGAFWGSFPTLFYRHLLKTLYKAGYTVVAMPFRFSFRHWDIALSLLEEQQRLQATLPQLAAQMGYAAEVYQSPAQYAWLGHSLGCKYIALMELLCGVESDPADTTLDSLIGRTQATRLRQRLATLPTIWNQPSQLLAPDIGDTTSALPISILARLLDRWGLGVQPTRQQTLALIDRSSLFNLTALVSYGDDALAQPGQGDTPSLSDVFWLQQYLQGRKLRHVKMPGQHLEPLGLGLGGWLVDLNPFDKFAKPLAQWPTGTQVQVLFNQLWRDAAPEVEEVESTPKPVPTLAPRPRVTC